MLISPVLLTDKRLVNKTIWFHHIKSDELACFDRNGADVLVLYETRKEPGVLQACLVAEGEEVLIPDQIWEPSMSPHDAKVSLLAQASKFALHWRMNEVHITVREGTRYMGCFLSSDAKVKRHEHR